MPVNIQIADSNFSLGPLTGFFYTVSKTLNSLLQVEADGTVANFFPISLSQLRNPVKQLHYDGTFFWTLEDLPSNLGLVIKKWRLYPFKTFAFPNATPIEFRWQDELTLIHGPTIRWEADAFAVEHYHRVFSNSFIKGATTIRLDSVDHLELGDTIYLGPSGFGGFIGNEETKKVQSINRTTHDVGLNLPIENSYLANDQVDYSKSLFLFNKNSFSGLSDGVGELVQFSLPGKQEIKSDIGGKYAGVTAADFDKENLCWVRGPQIIQLDIYDLTFDIQSSIEANLMQDDLFSVITVEDLIAELGSNLFLKLQQKESNEDPVTGSLSTTDFSPKYNFQSQTTLAVVNSVALDFDTRFSLPFPSADRIKIQATVRDQFNLPVLGKSVQFSATLNSDSPPGSPGTFSPTIAITTSSGTVNTTYTPSSTKPTILVDIQAKVL